MKPNEQDAAVRPGSESPNVGEIQILCDQESTVLLRRFPNFMVTLTAQVLFSNCMNIVA
jgi:hypothetical protein